MQEDLSVPILPVSTKSNFMLTERSILSQCEVLPNGIIQVRMSDQIVDGEVVKASTFRRYVLAPGSDLTGQPEQVVAIATAIWTPAAVASYTAIQELTARNKILESR